MTTSPSIRFTVAIGGHTRIPVDVRWNVVLVSTILSTAMATTALPAAAPGFHTPAYWAAALLVGALFVVSLATHEIAHAAVARRHHVRPRSIMLSCHGGATTFSADPTTPRAEFFVSAAGPAVNLAVGLLSVLLAVAVAAAGMPAVGSAALIWVTIVNVLLASLNMLPGASMDGGQLLIAVLWRMNGDRRRATAIAVLVGRVTGAALVLGGLVLAIAAHSYTGLWLFLPGLLLLSQSRDEVAVPTAR